jgi:hypothetical protein
VKCGSGALLVGESLVRTGGDIRSKMRELLVG